MGYASYDRPVRVGARAVEMEVEVEVVEPDIAGWVVCVVGCEGMGAVVGIGRGGIGAARSCDSGYVYIAR